jgi:signal transduction histidine kinase
MTGITPAPGNSIAHRRRGSWISAGLLGSVRGLALVGVALAEAFVLVGLIAAVTIELALAIFIYPLLLVPPTLRAGRRLTNLVRRLSGEWCGVPVPVPYRPSTEPVQGSVWRRVGCGFRVLGDPATWRDLLWMTVDPAAVAVLPLIPGSLVVWGLFGALMPAYWDPIVQAHGNNWYAFIHVTSWTTAGLSVPLGIAFIAFGLWIAPLFLRWYGQAALSMLAPTRQAALEQQVAHLAESRAEVVDTGAAEIRRIERDLHDGAQAQMVAVAMKLGLAREKLAGIVDNAGAGDLQRVLELVVAAHRGATEAITELRDLARGIHPPVLDHGLAEALASLAAGGDLAVEVVVDLPERPSAAIETITYFCAAELLTNVAKHSGAHHARLEAVHMHGLLRVQVSDDGVGGARVEASGGLAGLAERIAAVDGRLQITSPPKGPTEVVVELPLHT